MDFHATLFSFLGHSRTVIGVEESSSRGPSLLMLDPKFTPAQVGLCLSTWRKM